MRPRAWLTVAVGTALAFVVGVACKREAVETVTLDLGLDNKGSFGFTCTEDLTATCDAILQCVLRPGSRTEEIACINALCTNGGKTNRECANVAMCLRSDAGTAGACYNATCGSLHPLIERAADGKGGADVHLIVDYIGLGGTPGCRVSELRGWCGTHSCRPVRRTCIPLHLDAAALASPASVMKAISDGFGSSRTIDTDATDEPVIVRIIGVAKAGACTPEEEAPDRELAAPVVGCAYSCPTVLSANRGTLTIDYDLIGSKCTDVALTECVTVFADAGADGG
jgi:hypothetical protein